MKHPTLTTLTLLITLALTHAQAQWIHQPHNPQTHNAPQWTTTNKTLIHPHANATIHTHNNIITHITGTYTNTPEGTQAAANLITLAATGTTDQTPALTAHLPTNPPATRINNTILTLQTQTQTTTFTLTPITYPTQAFRKTRHTTPAVDGDPNAPLVRIYFDLGCLECATRILAAISNINDHPTPKRIEYHHAPVVSRELGTLAARATECVAAANPNAGVGYLLGLLGSQVSWVNAGATNTVFLQLALRGGLSIEGVNACVDDALTVQEVQFATEAAVRLGVVEGVTVFVDGFRMVDPGSVSELNRLLLVVLPEVSGVVGVSPELGGGGDGEEVEPVVGPVGESEVVEPEVGGP